MNDCGSVSVAGSRPYDVRVFGARGEKGMCDRVETRLPELPSPFVAQEQQGRDG